MDNEYAATRDEAKQRGDKYYFTGRPCKNGHVCIRRVAGAKCLECQSALSRRWGQNNKERVRLQNLHWRENNREAKREQSERWRKKYPEIDRENSKRWQNENWEARREIVRATNHRRRARKNKNADPMTGAEQRKWENEQSKICFYCETDCSDNYHVDHLYPLSKGGNHQADNLVIACPSCNLSKGYKDPEQFIEEKLAETSA